MSMLAQQSIEYTSVVPPVEQAPARQNNLRRRLGIAAAITALTVSLTSHPQDETTAGWTGGLIPLPPATTSEAPIEPALPALENPEAAFIFDLKPNIIQLDPPLPNPKGEQQIAPTGILLHWWAVDGNGDIEVLRRGLAGNKACGSTGCSVQYGITRSTEGQEAQTYRMMNSPTDIAYHASGGNNTAFGIEIEGTPEQFEMGGPNFDQAKFEAVVSLVLKLVKDFNIPLEGPADCGKIIGIHGHSELNKCGNSKIDVGEAYTQAVVAAVKYVLQK